jgi:hypothetical protein
MMIRFLRPGIAVVGAAAVLGLLHFASAGAGTNPQRLDAPAPELRVGLWLNTPGQAPLRLRDRLGKVTIVHFWTFG